MPEDDGEKGPELGGLPRKQGRPPKALSGLEGAQRDFAGVIRREFFDRLAGLGVTTAKISAALNERSEGFSGPSLSKFRSGERVPDRDKLLRLLAYAEEVADQPLPDGVRELVMEKYYAALEGTNPELRHFYELMDEREQVVAERDTAREEQRRARDELVQCQESLGQALRRVERLDAEVRQAEREELRRQGREEAAENEVVRLRERQDQLLRAVRGALAGQQAARKEIGCVQDLLVQQAQKAARSEAGLKEENAALAGEVSTAAARVEELERTERALRAELEQVTATLGQAQARSGELTSQHTVVLRSRALVSQRLSLARAQRHDLENKQAALKQREAAMMRQLTAAERRVADLESRLVAAYRSRDALLEDPAAPGRAVTEAVEAVDAAWQSYEVEISRIEQHVVLSPGGTTTAHPAGAGESADETAAEPAAPTAGAGAGADERVEPPGPPPQKSDPLVEPASPSATSVRTAPNTTVRPAREAKRWDDVAVVSWTFFAVLVLLIFLIITLWPQNWWPRGDDGSKEKTSQSATTGVEWGDKPVAGGPVPHWSSALSYPLDNQPVLDGAVVITTAWHGAVYGVDARTGRLLWTVPITDTVSDQPVATGGLTHINGVDGLQTIDTRSGKVRWQKFGYSDVLAAAHGSLLMATEDEVASLRPSDGKVLWSVELDAPVVGRAALVRDTVYVSARKGLIYALNAKTGAVRWRKDVSNEDASRSPVVAGSAVIVDAGTQIVALDARSGKELWRRDYTIDGWDADVAVASGLLIFTASFEDDSNDVVCD
ncbi:PQQ-binding-like beta-propeller repeat protein [Streptomyces agglomeratus]|uniref:PQQ-binding-like beta-propeller repeat protein n=1 Tax=Streptomyces agglomeratus TaxID=285458 RepID=UPI000854E283|nr:PQQ-binding-like beta-propeller repeat protein [Streptomyces agglomeratus]OEJ36528.1 hypothetical protein BGK72_38170 [Streptomyces agglomeratus]